MKKSEKQKRWFNIISGPESRQKKSYEQLRPRSIDWLCQMVGLAIESWLNQNQGLGFWTHNFASIFEKRSFHFLFRV